MPTIEDIEKAVEQLAPRELARFRAWFEAFEAKRFDAAIKRDAHAGKLDAHADEALAAPGARMANTNLRRKSLPALIVACVMQQKAASLPINRPKLCLQNSAARTRRAE